MTSLRDLRKAKKISQEQLAEMAGVDQTTISKIERGDDGVTLRVISLIAHALGVEPVEVIGLPQMQARALRALSAIDPDKREAALIVLEAMTADRQPR